MGLFHSEIPFLPYQVLQFFVDFPFISIPFYDSKQSCSLMCFDFGLRESETIKAFPDNILGVKHALSIVNHAHEHHRAFIIT